MIQICSKFKTVRNLMAIGVFFLLVTPGLFAQGPMGVEEKQEKKPAQTVVSPTTQANDPLARYWQRFMGPESPYRAVILSILTLAILMKVKSSLTRRIEKQLKENAFFTENADSFLKMWHMVWKFGIAILVVIAMSGSIKVLGLTAGFIGMILGWSLQQPVTGLAAWLMIVSKKPFKIGDRVVIAGITGDVMSINLTHVVLNQVGGSVSGEERSGRGILIPNAILFQQTIINYTFDQEFMLDEVPVRLTFDCDWDEAKRLMIEAAKEAAGEIIEKTGTQPFVRVELLDWGLLARLRYNTIPAKRQEISTAVIENLLHKFKEAYPKVRFAIPSSTVHYRRDSTGEPEPAEGHPAVGI